MEAIQELRAQELVDAVPFWWHSIDFGDGVVSKGRKTSEIHANEVRNMQIPRLDGKTVLDIGAWDGFYSFEAERRGASRVVALDHFVWSKDLRELGPFWGDRSQEIQPSPDSGNPEAWDPQVLPGKIGFDTARSLLQSRVESVVGDWMEMDLNSIGSFDVVFYLGVLYHMKNPLQSLMRLAQVTREVAIIESEAVALLGFEDRAFCEFFESDELAQDATNWWSPNRAALEGMCRAAGFRHVVHTIAPPEEKTLLPGAPRRYRATVHAYK